MHKVKLAAIMGIKGYWLVCEFTLGYYLFIPLTYDINDLQVQSLRKSLLLQTIPCRK